MQGKTVLLIEDDTLVRAALVSALTEHGLSVIDRAAGDRTGQLARTFRPDFVVTDLNVRGANGLLIISEIRAQQPDLPIVAITGASEEALELALRAGADACVMKPFKAALLFTVLQEAAQRRSAS